LSPVVEVVGVGAATAKGDPPWWQSAVVYQVYPRSFADRSGDGIGDLAGLLGRLPYVAALGVDAIWLSPVFRSPMADFGYDVSDYCDVDPLFGTLADLDRLVGGAHRHGLRLLLDWVPNHTSDRHPWFLESRSSRRAAKRDWYVWRDPKADGSPPNNWTAAFRPGHPAWTLDPSTGQFYLHSFLPEQPDLDWSNPEVRAAMHEVLHFWLERGVDGFRVDVAHCLGKDPALPDDPEHLVVVPHCALNHHPSTAPILAGLRRLVDGYAHAPMLVGEVFLVAPHEMSDYSGPGAFHLAFDLPGSLHTPWDADAWRSRTAATAERLGRDAWPTLVLSNHDTPRHRTRFGSEARARAAAVLLLGLPGTPFLYAGEELGLEDAAIPPERRLDPGGRDGCRAPLPWNDAPGHGWDAEPWLPFPPEAGRRSVARQEADPGSMLLFYRRLLAARRASPALRAGDWRDLDAAPGVFAWERRHGGDRRVCAVNFASAPRTIALVGDWRVEAGTHRTQAGAAFDGRLAADEAVVLRPD
jgi:alpha-glucosidase